MERYLYEIDRIYRPAEDPAGRVYENERLLDNLNGRGQNGWRFVAALPAVQDAAGRTAALDLVFEKEAAEER